MNSKQRKQTEKLRAAALDGLESKQQLVEAQIARLEKLREEQDWRGMANKMARDTVKDVLMMLELDEDPTEIARQVRAKHDILESTW